MRPKRHLVGPAKARRSAPPLPASLRGEVRGGGEPKKEIECISRFRGHDTDETMKCRFDRRLPAIAASVPEGQPYWIDMESGVRTEDRFDLDKCELVLMQVYDAG